MPFVQIVHFPVSQATANQDLFKAPLEAIKAAEGHTSSYYGVQVEDADRAYFVSVWESYEHHQKLVNDPSYSTLVEGLRAASIDSNYERHQIKISGDVLKALSAPAVEVVLFTLQPGGSAEKYEALMGDLAKGLDKADGEHPPCAWAQTVEDKTKYQLIVGWDTVEVRITRGFLVFV
ncbi:hypothetical protein FB45DRAFT_736479 [Roridomyces roridus]|uniref:ABM domain-containing protein n=1 Tax=Roridomyces roridus TaxID=1738132 RepID=A0AAD7FY00_9AGAR|nr:hypothetical protein FB45DRAFT_736479 [Roridomyces roridus]